MMASPFPHMHAKAAADKLAKTEKKNEVRELFVTGCWRAGILIICTLAATLVYQVAVAQREGRLHFNWGQGMTEFSMVRRVPMNATASDHYFLDIGMSRDDVQASMSGRHLEQKGWNGVCAVPLPGDLTGRTCKVVALPVGVKDGEQIAVQDCSQVGLLGLMRMFMEVECPEVKATTVSIGKLLAIASAPKVIDFVSMDSQSAELEILQSFPFGEHCVRAWSIASTQNTTLAGMKSYLQVSQGCRVRTEGAQLWGRCPCGEQKQESVAPDAKAKQPANLAQIEVLASGTGSRRKGTAAPHESTVLSADAPLAK